MSTFLQLAQKVAREGGTVSDLTSPATVTSQTGRLLRVVNWTSDAYNDIQRRRSDWRWLRQEFSGETIINVQRYLAASMGIASRFNHWIFSGERQDPTFSVYLTSAGRTEEGWLSYLPWREFRAIYMFGSAASDTGKPAYVTVDPQQQLVFYPIPDGAYTIRGEYYQSPQILVADADVPEMPEAHHDAIKWQALILMGTFDEATEQMSAWVAFLREHQASLERTQTPRISIAGPLA